MTAKPPQHDESELMAEALSSLINKQPASPKRRRHWPYSKILKLTTLVISVATLVAGIVWVITRDTTSDLEKKLSTYTADAASTVYAPTSLPAGYQADLNKTTESGGVVFSTLDNKDSSKPAIVISQQATPPNVGIQSLLGLMPPEPVKTPHGDLFIASTDTALTAVLVTTSSWVIMSTDKSVNPEVLQDIANRLKPLN